MRFDCNLAEDKGKLSPSSRHLIAVLLGRFGPRQVLKRRRRVGHLRRTVRYQGRIVQEVRPSSRIGGSHVLEPGYAPGFFLIRRAGRKGNDFALTRGVAIPTSERAW
jgi:hypothetical protein